MFLLNIYFPWDVAQFYEVINRYRAQLGPVVNALLTAFLVGYFIHLAVDLIKNLFR